MRRTVIHFLPRDGANIDRCIARDDSKLPRDSLRSIQRVCDDFEVQDRIREDVNYRT